MTEKEHRQRHRELHKALDELVADWARHNPGKIYSDSSIMDLMEWSFKQTQNPTPTDSGLSDDLSPYVH